MIDNQSAKYRIGDDACHTAGTFTPRIAADGKIALAAEIQTKQTVGVVVNLQTVQLTESVPNGGTIVVRGLCSKSADGKITEVLAVMTVERFTSEINK